MDLPLSSNHNDVKVFHWVLDLSCHFPQEQFHGSVTLLCQAKTSLPSCPADGQNNQVLGSESESNNGHSCASVKTCELLEETESKPADIINADTLQTFVLDSHALDIEACYLYNLNEEDLLEVANVHHQSSTSRSTENISNIDEVKNNNAKLQIPSACMDNYLKIYTKLDSSVVGKLLDFSVEEHCLRINIPKGDLQGCQLLRSFAVKIVYKTQKGGQSLTWTKDQDSRPCVYTSGHLLNNRCLMPCQDVPQAMSTWHCFISVPRDNDTLVDLTQTTVLMAGEAQPNLTVSKDGSYVFGYSSSYPMPAATFALAVGTWPLHQVLPNQEDVEGSHGCPEPSLRIFAPLKLQRDKVARLARYLPACFSALHSVLGPYPLLRLDILVVPPSFDSLGMMCPHMMLLSQSILLCGDEAAASVMFYRVAHELCHTWLGVLTGPRDWTEEWLTEGICCYLEDIVHARALQWSESEARERLELRCFLKYRILKAELNNTSEDLQMLRPNGEETSASQENINQQPSVIKNGLNSQKTLLQVHYLKGFFLLKHLEQLSGKEEFLQTLTTFIRNNLGNLFSSKELLMFCFEKLPKLSQSGLTVAKVCQEWLDSPGIPQSLVGYEMDRENSLNKKVQRELSFLKTGASRKRMKSSHRLKTVSSAIRPPSFSVVAPASPASCEPLLPEQSVLLLDLLVENDVKVTCSQMEWLRDRLRIQDAGPEVQHSWCELVVQRKALRWLEDVQSFLTHHQAMGVYLYGELIISENAQLQALAHRVFQSLRSCMAEGQRLAVEEMLFPT